MKFNWENRNEIDDIYIHDSILKGYSYDYEKRIIELYCEYEFPEKKIYEVKFVFHNVIMNQLQSCYLWGRGLHVMVVYYEQENILLKEIKKMMMEEKQKYGHPLYLGDKMEYIPIVFEMNSGDTLTIICEEFDYEEYWK